MEMARVNVPDGFSSRASRVIEHAAADAQDSAKIPAHNFFTAPARLEHLLDDAIFSLAR
jgi:hypothetical protein